MKHLLAALALLLPVAAVAHAAPRPIQFLPLGKHLCPSTGELRRALAHQLGAARIVEGGAVATALELRITAEGRGRLLVRLRDGDLVSARRLEAAPAECGRLAETAALLVDAWLHQVPWQARDREAVAVRHEVHSSRERPSPAHVDSPTETSPRRPAIAVARPAPPANPPPHSAPETEQVAAPIVAEKSLVVATAADPPSSSTPPVSPAPPTASPVAAPQSLAAATPPARRTAIHLTARLAGLGALGLSSGKPLIGGGQLGLDLGLGDRFALGLRAAAAGVITLTAPSGQVAIERFPITLVARVLLHAIDRSGFSILAGFLLDFSRAQASGFTTNGNANTIDPGLVAAAAFDWVLSRRVSLFAGLEAAVLLKNESFQVTNIGAIGTTPYAWLELDAGVAIHFF